VPHSTIRENSRALYSKTHAVTQLLFLVNTVVRSRNIKVLLRFNEFTIIYIMVKIECIALLCDVLNPLKVHDENL
jgi:hypothetical protein